MLGGVLPKWKNIRKKNSKFPYFAVLKSASVIFEVLSWLFLTSRGEYLEENLLTRSFMKHLLYIIFAHFSLVYDISMPFFLICIIGSLVFFYEK